MDDHCEALGKLREARAILLETEKESRELSIVITKIDEAILWRQRDRQLKAPPINISNQDSLMLSDRDCIDLMNILSRSQETCAAQLKIANFINRHK